MSGQSYYASSMPTRSACVITGTTPAQLAAPDGVTLRANRHGTLAVGKIGDFMIDAAMDRSGPVYDIMWNADTGWFAVTIYRGEQVVRWDNRPGTNPGYPRTDDVLGATTPRTILEALDVPAEAIGYADA